MNGQNDLMKDEDEVVLHEVKEFIGNDCRTSSVTGMLSLDTYKSDVRITKSLSGCIHLCDGSGLATWSFYDTDKQRLIKSADELRKMARILEDFADAITLHSDVVGEFPVETVVIKKVDGKTVILDGDKVIGQQG
jgi:hypothetical protein